MARACAWLVLLAACAPAGGVGSAAQAEERGPPSILDVIDAQLYDLPFDVPDELCVVPDAYHVGHLVSLREGEVTSAWTTAPALDGTPSAIVYRCARGARGGYRWAATPDAWLAPLGLDLSAYPDLLPFTARVTVSAPPGVLLPGSAGPAFTLDAAVRFGASHSRLAGAVEASIPSFDGEDLPLLRVRKTNAARVGLYDDGAFDRPDFVLRLRTRGGVGPGEGTSCAPGDAPVRAPFDAEYWFVRLGNVTSTEDLSDAGGGGVSGR